MITTTKKPLDLFRIIGSHFRYRLFFDLARRPLNNQVELDEYGVLQPIVPRQLRVSIDQAEVCDSVFIVVCVDNTKKYKLKYICLVTKVHSGWCQIFKSDIYTQNVKCFTIL